MQQTRFGRGANAAILLVVLTLGAGALTAAATPLSSAFLRMEGTGGIAGHSTAIVGDVNGDDYADMLIADPYHSSNGLNNNGAAYLVWGSPWWLTIWGQQPVVALSANSWAGVIELTGESTDDLAGYSVAAAGDVNADGYADLLIGAPLANGTGAVYLVLGGQSLSSGSLASRAIRYDGEAWNDNAGWSVAGAGDVNADGYDDLLVGAPRNSHAGTAAGAAYLVLGSSAPQGGSLSQAVRYTGEAAGDYAGLSVAGAGQFSSQEACGPGDYYPSMVIGAPGRDAVGQDSGAVYLVFGGPNPMGGSLSTAFRYNGEAAGDWAGFSVTGLGDVNQDGMDDVAVSAPWSDRGGLDAGTVYVLRGTCWFVYPTSLSSQLRFWGQAPHDNAGLFLGGPGDVNGDGRSDLLVGAPDNSNNGYWSGTAYLVLGDNQLHSDSLGAAIQYWGVSVYDGAGYGVSGGGDINGDGRNDMLIGAPWAGVGGTAYLVAGF